MGILNSTDMNKRESVETAPRDLKRFEVHVDEYVDYEHHPSYASLIQQVSVVDRVFALSKFLKNYLLILCKRLISYELIPTHVRDNQSISGRVLFAKRAASNVMLKLFKNGRASQTSQGIQVHSALQDDGVCIISLGKESYENIVGLAAPLFDELRKKRSRVASKDGSRDFSESRDKASFEKSSALYEAVERAFLAHGVLDGCTGYLGYQAKLVDINPQINDETDNFWSRIFLDQNTPQPKTAYLHKDASGGDLKIIIYLSNVLSENGPFSYAVGTHKLHRRDWRSWIEEANDQSGLSGTNLKNRKLFSSLPRFLRRKAAFGNDLRDDSNISQQILQSEWKVCAPAGSMVLFVPKGMHRGGMVNQGERVVLTCVIGSASI